MTQFEAGLGWDEWGGCMLEFTQVEVAGGKQTKGFATREMQLWDGFELLVIYNLQVCVCGAMRGGGEDWRQNLRSTAFVGGRI